jgi:hypothetical protein
VGKMTVEYKVKSEKFEVEVEVLSTTTPRSIAVSCGQDYAKKTGVNVRPAHYDDDNDVYINSNVDIVIKASKAMLELPTLKSLGLTFKELKEML